MLKKTGDPFLNIRDPNTNYYDERWVSIKLNSITPANAIKVNDILRPTWY